MRYDVTFVLAKLEIGGIERNRLKIINQCIRWGLNVRVILLEMKGDLLRELPGEVETKCLGSPFKWFFPLRLVVTFSFGRTATVISAFDDVNVMVVFASLLTRGRIPILLSNHNTFSEAWARSTGLKWVKFTILRYLLPWAFKRARAVVAVSSGVADDLAKTLRFPRSSIEVIYNPVIDKDFYSRARQEPAHSSNNNTILFVGRFVPQKDLPTLLEAVNLLAARRKVDLLMIGDGPQRQEVESIIQKTGLADVVRLVGTVENPLPVMARCGVLVLSSRFEGLPGVLIEALACGTQVVSTDCPHGPAEILEGGRYGQLVPVGDPPALAEAIERSLSRKFWVDPEILKVRASEFSVEKATRRYLELAGYDVSTLPPTDQPAPRTDPANG